MKTSQKHYPIVHMGTSFMLVILVVLCMVIFSILSLSTAISDARYSKQRASNLKEYYSACNIAEEKLAYIQSYYDSNKSLTGVKKEKKGKHTYLSYQVPMKKNSYLSVLLEVKQTNGKSNYIVKRWNQVTTDTWNNDDSLDLMKK